MPPTDPPAPVVSGNHEVRLARTEAEIRAGQALRYRVFYEEMGAHPTPEMLSLKRDFDQFDAVCDHLIVVDQSRESGSQVVGTYRVMRREHVRAVGGFYSASEYDVSRLASFSGTVMELGRSCVDAGYRNRATMQLLWRGIAEYTNAHGVDLMFGCASLHGTDPDALATELTYLHAHHLAPPELRMRAVASRYVEMRRLDPAAIAPLRALAALPPLIKGYLRLGCFVGDGAVIDSQFNTVDVAIVVKTDLITDKYFKHYERTTREPDGREAEA